MASSELPIPDNSLERKYDGRSKSSRENPKLSARKRRKLTSENIDRAIARIGQLIDSEKEATSLEACKFVIEQCIGRAPLREDMRSSAKPSQDNRIQMAIQSLIMPMRSPENVTSNVTSSALAPHTLSGNVTDDVTSDPSGREGPPVK